MVENTVSEQEGRYDILENNAGEIMIIIKYREGGPENPRLVYDGGEVALLYRSRESAILLDNIDERARPSLKSVEKVLMVEIDKDEVAREYDVPLRLVKDLGALLKSA